MYLSMVAFPRRLPRFINIDLVPLKALVIVLPKYSIYASVIIPT